MDKTKVVMCVGLVNASMKRFIILFIFCFVNAFGQTIKIKTKYFNSFTMNTVDLQEMWIVRLKKKQQQRFDIILILNNI